MRPRKTKSCTRLSCSADHYAKGLCKQHYMVANREKFAAKKEEKPELDVNDFWEFVKKELQIG